VGGDTDVDDPAALEGDDDERVKGLEMHRDDGEEVAGPNLRGVVTEKGHPVLPAATRQVLRPVLGDRARRDTPAELRELAGNPVLSPQAVLSPHTPDEGPQLDVDLWPADPTARAPTPPKPPRRSMPPENRRRPDQDHGLEQGMRSGREHRDEPSVQSLEPWSRRRAAQHDQLLAQQEVLGGDDGVRGEEPPDGCDYVAKEVDHRAILRRGGLARPLVRARRPRAEFLRRTGGRGLDAAVAEKADEEDALIAGVERQCSGCLT
jgi:hypothetical protein